MCCIYVVYVVLEGYNTDIWHDRAQVAEMTGTKPLSDTEKGDPLCAHIPL